MEHKTWEIGLKPGERVFRIAVEIIDREGKKRRGYIADFDVCRVVAICDQVLPLRPSESKEPFDNVRKIVV